MEIQKAVGMKHGLAIHENARQIQLHLKADIDVGTIDGWTPPESETTIEDLIGTGAPSIRELLVSHPLLETGRHLPERTSYVGAQAIA